MPTKILYVEDEPFLGKIVKESLESRDFDVHMVTDGQYVMAAYEQYRPDICLLDVMLPNVDGFTLGKQIRAKHPTMPILFLTAKNQTADLLKGFAVGGNDYIKKPFSMEELIVRVENLVKLVGNGGQAIKDKQEIGIGSFTFYPMRHELARAGNVTKLSHKETQILDIFVSQPNQTIDRRAILKKVWGDDSFFNSRNLDVYIRKLRSHFEADEAVKIITLKGVGYCFVVG